ncbi:MAG: hypothetical protein KAV82_01525 [Phycisphaerae bacterium]|nr:hypothetical protein [Phycisphaerae bacterium]
MIRTAPAQLQAALAGIIERIRAKRKDLVGSGDAYDAYKAFCTRASLKPLTLKEGGMIVIPIPMFASPLGIVVAAIDTYLIVAAAYFLLRRFAIDFPESRHHILRRAIEGPIEYANRRLTKWRGRTVPSWAPCVTVLTALVVVRTITAGLIMAMV